MSRVDKLILTGLIGIGAGVILYPMALAGYPLVCWAFAALGIPL